MRLPLQATAVLALQLWAILGSTQPVQDGISPTDALNRPAASAPSAVDSICRLGEPGCSSVGRVKYYTGDVKGSAELRAALESCSFHKEVNMNGCQSLCPD